MNTLTPFDRARRLAAARPEPPFNAREIVTDELLRTLARQTPERDAGQLSETDQAILAVILPDICGELLARRLAEDAAAAPQPA